MHLISRIARAPLAMALVVLAAVAMLVAPLIPATPPEPAGQEQALAAAEQAALADPALSALIEELDASVQAGMRAADPEYDAKIARLSEIAADTAEAQELRAQLMATQAKVIEAEPLASQIEDAQEKILAKMTEIDPQVPVHLERLGGAPQ